MRHAFVFEAVEPRKHLSASWSAQGVNIIGESTGLHAAATTPTFDQLLTSARAEPQNSQPARADLDSAVKLTIAAASNNSGIDPSTDALFRGAIQITNLDTGVVYNQSRPGSENITRFLQKVKTTGGGDALIIQPNDPWQANTRYRVDVNGAYTTGSLKVRDVQGVRFAAFSGEFTTGDVLPRADGSIAFKQFKQTAPGARAYIATAIGPDRRLYAATSQGSIYRYDIAADGTLGNEFTINTIRNNNGGDRIITGITFQPNATADNFVMWVSHNQYRFGSKPGQGGVNEYADNFTGKISRIGRADWSSYEDIVVNIPRSAKDHMNNQITFDPTGRTFLFGIAAMNAMGAPDPIWANRDENIYSASVVRVRVGSASNGLNPYLRARGPVDLVVRSNGTTPYNIFKGSNPLRLYATGVRNDFDMVYHSNGRLYAGINGSSAGGNVPGTPAFSSVPIQNRTDKDVRGRGTFTGPGSNPLSNVRQVMQDTLLDLRESAYYGHPNATRGEYILMGGNPTGSDDPYEIAQYPVGQQPDRNFTLPVYDFGQNFSPNGLLEYKSVNGMNRNLDGYLLVCRYSGGSDILAIKPNRDGTVTANDTNIQQRITGFTGLNSPLDIVQDTTNGNLYVVNLESEAGPGGITLLKPDDSLMPNAVASVSRLGFYVQPGGPPENQKVTIINNGTQDLVFDPAASRIGGSGRRNFLYGKNFPRVATTIVPGQSLTLNITAQLLRGQTATAGATLQLKTNDPDTPFLNVVLRAFNENATA